MKGETWALLDCADARPEFRYTRATFHDVPGTVVDAWECVRRIWCDPGLWNSLGAMMIPTPPGDNFRRTSQEYKQARLQMLIAHAERGGKVFIYDYYSDY